MRFPFPADLDPDRDFLTLELVLAFHLGVLAPGQRTGVLSMSALEGALGRVLNAVAYDPEADIVTAAAYYWHGITTSHAFEDGNKRTGVFAAIAFLHMHGLELEIEDDYLGPIAEALVAKRNPVEHYEGFLRQFVR